jgi:hypothetical protein
MINYENYSFVLPPRAEIKVPVEMLRFYEKRNFLAQVKINGTNNVIFIPPKGEIFAKTRHGEDHKLWSFTPASLKQFEKLRTKNWNVYNAELLHSKIAGVRDINYVHDVLVHDGKYLAGTSYEYRHKLLSSLLKGKDRTQSHVIIDDHTWLARNHTGPFKALFESLGPTDEGLVLKEPGGLLSSRDNSSWTVKCRRPHKNFGF